MHIDRPDNATSKALVCVGVALQAGTEDSATVLEGSDWAEKELLIDGKPWEVEAGTSAWRDSRAASISAKRVLLLVICWRAVAKDRL
jgi:hypothetical protein